MPRQAIRQATCTECGENDDNHTVTTTETGDDEERIDYSVRCSCGETATVTLDNSGTSASDNISYDGASWNEDSDESSDDESNE